MRIEKSYYDKETGLYIDTTTGRTYQPKEYCEICGKKWVQLDVHHYLNQQKCLKDMRSKDPKPKHWTKEFIQANQKLFTLCRDCHYAVEHYAPDKTINGRRLGDYIYPKEEKKKVVTPPRAFVVKRGNDVRDKQDL